MSCRQLYLSRKYGVIWGRKVFGRVLPSAARRHHTHQLKRRSIGAWSQVWWSARREWKLNIRADCHNRQVGPPLTLVYPLSPEPQNWFICFSSGVRKSENFHSSKQSSTVW